MAARAGLRGRPITHERLVGRPVDAGGAVTVFGVAAVLLALYVTIPFVLRGFRFPVGPDASVYLWWIGLVRMDGLSVLGNRAGVPAAVLALSGSSGISPVTLFCAFTGAVATAVGLAAGALAGITDGTNRRQGVLAGVLAGAFAAHVAGGYYSALGFAALFMALVALLAVPTRRAAVLAAACLAAAGLTHPELAGLAALTLLAAALLAWIAGVRDEALRIGGCLAGGVVASVVGGLVLLAGPAPPVADTSRDTFLIRAGAGDLVRRLYTGRLALNGWSYAPILWLPLAAAGVGRVHGSRRRLLVAWASVSGLAVLVGALTGWFPPERAISVAFVVPVLAAFGLERLLARRGALVAAIGVGAILAVGGVTGWRWWHTSPPVYETEAARVTDAARYAASAPPGTPLVFQVSGPQPVLTFLATRAANEIRAAMPPGRIRDAFVVVPPPAPGADEEREALSAMFNADVADAVARSGHDPLVFRLTVFIRAPFPEPPDGFPPPVGPGIRIAGDVPEPAASTPASLAPTTLGRIVVGTIVVLAVLWLTGLGWVRAALPHDSRSLPMAPAIGLTALILAAIALERLGVPIDHTPGAIATVAMASVPGWLLARRAAGEPTEVDPLIASPS